jgi:preprotein translocase subunit SecD
MKINISHSLALLAGAMVVSAIGSGCRREDNGIKAPLASPPAHGTEFVIQAEPDKLADFTNSLPALETVIRKRFSESGYQIFWQQLQPGQVRIVTTITDMKAVAAVGVSAFRNSLLEIRLVHEDSAALMKEGLIAPGYELLKKSAKGPDGRLSVASYQVRKKPEGGLSGKHVKSALVNHDPMGRPELLIEFNPEGTKIFEQITTENTGRQLAIVLDGKLQSAPMIHEPISGGRCSISGNFTKQEAEALVGALNSPLPAPVTVIESKTF